VFFVRAAPSAPAAGLRLSPAAGASITQKRSDAVNVTPFPYSRRRHLVERHARAMRGLSPDEAEAYLTSVLETVCKELDAIGVDCETDNMIFGFADAIGKELHGAAFRLNIDGGAK
jgi:hypothetical protein